MTYLILGILAFICYFLYDLNSVLWKNVMLQKSFLCGSILLFFGTIQMIRCSLFVIKITMLSLVGLIGSVTFFWLLLYTLFFALPFKQTYIEGEQPKEKETNAYTEGVYALCRHPGVLWFIGFYGFLILMMPTKSMIFGVILFSVLNILYVVLQDYWTFVYLFSNYSAYKQMTPFLIPNRESICRCFSTLSKRRSI